MIILSWPNDSIKASRQPPGQRPFVSLNRRASQRGVAEKQYAILFASRAIVADDGLGTCMYACQMIYFMRRKFQAATKWR